MPKKFQGSTDVPLAEQADDRLAIRTYAQGLARFVRECQTPMTIAVQGEWGSGKTSLMQLVRRSLEPAAGAEDRSEVLCHWFDAWQYGATGDAELLGVQLLRDLTKTLQQRCDENNIAVVRAVDKLKRGFSAFAAPAAKAVVSGATSTATGGLVNGEVLAGGLFGGSGVEVGEIREAFETVVKTAVSTNGRVVVFVDDLDRIRPARAVALLEVLKNFMDVRDTVFVVACDYDVVREGVRDLMGISDDVKVEAFFHKIFQVPFQMPIAAYTVRPLLAEWIIAKVGKLNGESESVAKDISPLIEDAVGTNPRAFKRYLNTVDLHCAVDAAYPDTPGRGEPQWHHRIQRWDADSLRRWLVSLLGLYALEMAWPDVAAWMMNEALAKSKPERAAEAFERALSTLGANVGTGDDDLAGPDEELIASVILRSDRFGGASWRESAAGESLSNFATKWMELLDSGPGIERRDRRLSAKEIEFLWKWARRSASQINGNVKRRGNVKFSHEVREEHPEHGDAFMGVVKSVQQWASAHERFHVAFDQRGLLVQLEKHPTGLVRLLRFEHHNNKSLYIRVAAHTDLDSQTGIESIAPLLERFTARLAQAGFEGRITNNYRVYDFGVHHRDGDLEQLEALLTAFRDVVDAVGTAERRLGEVADAASEGDVPLADPAQLTRTETPHTPV